MPVDSRIPLGMEYSDPVAKFQQGFGTAREVVNAPLKTEALKQDNELTKLKTAASKIDAIGGLLYGVDNQDKYAAKRNVAISQGLAKPEEIPETYDPNVVAGWQNSLEQAKMQIDKAYKLATIQQMQAGGSTGVFADRLKNEPDLRDAYFGKTNAGKGLYKDPETGKVEIMPGYNEAVAGTEGAKKQAEVSGGIKAKTQTEAEVGLSDFIASADNQLSVIDQMIGNPDKNMAEHPGLKSAVGGLDARLPSFKDKSVDFDALLEQARSGAFLTSIGQLQGMGALSNAEGQTATAAATRMKAATSESGFRKAAAEYREVISKGVERMKQKASGVAQEDITLNNTEGLTPAEKAAGDEPRAGRRVKNSEIPRDAIYDLKKNPATAAQFDEVFGKGASKWVLGK